MALDALLDAVERLPAFHRILNTLPSPGERVVVGGLPGSADAAMVAALDDDAESPHFIETLPRHGYRFIGSVNGSAQTPTVEAGPQASQISRWRFSWSALAASVVLAALVLWSVSRTGPMPPKILKQKQLTSSSVGNAIVNGAISPD